MRIDCETKLKNMRTENMSTTDMTDNQLELLGVKDGTYLVKVDSLDIPVKINEYLYKRWTQDLQPSNSTYQDPPTN